MTTARTGLADAGAYEFGEPELAATGADTTTAGWLAGIAALRLGAGAAVMVGSRNRSRVGREGRTPPNDLGIDSLAHPPYKGVRQ